MDEAQIQKLIDEIDQHHQVGEPRMQIFQGKPLGFIFLMANRDGLIRLARLFLVAAMSPIDPATGAWPVEVDVEGVVVDEKSDLILGSIELTSTVPISDAVLAERRKEAWNEDGCFVIGLWTVGLGLLFLLVSGLVFWIGLLTGDWR